MFHSAPVDFGWRETEDLKSCVRILWALRKQSSSFVKASLSRAYILPDWKSLGQKLPASWKIHNFELYFYYRRPAANRGLQNQTQWGKIMNLLESVTEAFVRKSREILSENLVGVYLHGSAVMGCFNEKNIILWFYPRRTIIRLTSPFSGIWTAEMITPPIC